MAIAESSGLNKPGPIEAADKVIDPVAVPEVIRAEQARPH